MVVVVCGGDEQRGHLSTLYKNNTGSCIFLLFNLFLLFVVRRANYWKEIEVSHCNSLVFESKRKFLVGCYRLSFQHPAIVFVTYRKLQKCLYSNSRNDRRYLIWLIEQMLIQ